LAADYDSASRLLDQVSTVLAWQSINDDIKDMRLNLDQYQAKQARQSLATAQDALQRMVAEVYKWLISPMQTASAGSVSEIQWEPFPLNAASQSMPKAIEQVLRDNEWVISEWSPIHLRNLLKQWFWKPENPNMPAREVWQHICRQLYLPRLKGENVFTATIQAGSGSRDFFGFAQGKEGERYLGFTFGALCMPFIDSDMLLIAPEAATAYQGVLDEEKRQREEQAASPIADQPSTPAPRPTPTPSGGTFTATAPLLKRRYYASIDMEPYGIKMRFADIADNIIQHLAERPDTRVTVSIEIQAESNTGFQEDIQRILKENCNTLRFRNAEFEE
jgi:hypothetical protein